MIKTKTKFNNLSLGTQNRNKGHDYERLWAKRFRELGYDKCKTSRQASRLIDSCKIDLVFIPYNVQCKNVRKNINYTELFDSIERELKNNIPANDPIHSYPLIIAHKRGRKKNEEHIIMTSVSFLELLKKIKNGEE